MRTGPHERKEKEKMKTIVRFEEKDNVAVVLVDSRENQEFCLGEERITAREKIPYGHKIALHAMKKGDTVYKYGEPVAKCTEDIEKGSWVHVHNVESIRGLGHR